MKHSSENLALVIIFYRFLQQMAVKYKISLLKYFQLESVVLNFENERKFTRYLPQEILYDTWLDNHSNVWDFFLKSHTGCIYLIKNTVKQ